MHILMTNEFGDWKLKYTKLSADVSEQRKFIRSVEPLDNKPLKESRRVLVTLEPMDVF